MPENLSDTPNHLTGLGPSCRQEVQSLMAKLPQEYSTVLTAGGFEPQPVNAENMPAPILSALASKESGPPREPNPAESERAPR